MFLSILQTVGNVGAWMVAIIIVMIIKPDVSNGSYNEYYDADSAGWASILGPLFTLIPLGLTIPFVIKAYYHLMAHGNSKSIFILVPLTLLAYVYFFVSLFTIYYPTERYVENIPYVPIILLWISSTIIIGFMFYGLLGAQHGRLVFLSTGVLLSLVTLVPMIQNMSLIRNTKFVVTAHYGTPFDPKDFKEYEFPDFILKPSLETRSYEVLDKETRTQKNFLNFCAHNNELRTNCVDFSKGYGYDELRLLDGDAIDGKYYVIHPRGEMVVIEEKL